MLRGLLASGSVMILVGALAALLLYPRLFISADFTDEAYYVALPYSYLLGQRPYIDELSLAQNPGALLLPLVKGYVALSGGTSGIVLFFRHLFLLLNFLCAVFVWKALQNEVSRPVAILSALLFFVYVPFGIFGVSYNTLAMQGFTLGCLSYYRAAKSEDRRWYFYGNLFLTVSAFSYPPMSVALIGLNLLLLWSVGARWWGGVWPLARTWLLPVGVAVLASAWMLKDSSLENLRTIGRYYESFGVYLHWQDKLQILLAQGIDIVAVGHYFILGLALTLLAAGRGVPILGAGALFGILFLARKHFVGLFFHAVPLVLGFLGLAALAWRRGADRAADMLPARLLVLPGILVAVLFALTSGNSLVNATLGIWPALFGAAILVERRHKNSVGFLGSLLLAVTVFEVYALYAHSYGNADPLKANTVRMREGPYAGIWMTPVKADLISKLAQRLASLPGGSILFLEGFPAGYLLSSRAPATASLWPLSSTVLPSDRGVLLDDYIERKRSLPDFVVVLKRYPVGRGVYFEFEKAPVDAYKAFFTGPGYPVIAQDPEFEIRSRHTDGGPPQSPLQR